MTLFSVVALLQLQLKTLRSSPSTYTARYSRKPRTESRLSKLTVGRRTDPEMHCTYTKTIPLQLQFVFAAFCKCTPPGTGEERTPRCMHLYLRAAVQFCKPSASAHLRGHVENGPCDACTYTCVLRFVFAAFCKCTAAGCAGGGEIAAEE